MTSWAGRTSSSVQNSLLANALDDWLENASPEDNLLGLGGYRLDPARARREIRRLRGSVTPVARCSPAAGLVGRNSPPVGRCRVTRLDPGRNSTSNGCRGRQALRRNPSTNAEPSLRRRRPMGV
jgi:hypothetical protein